MLKIHFLSALRILLKNRGVTMINMVGLTIGLTAFLFIIHYLYYEKSFDSFFPDDERVYRVNMDMNEGNNSIFHSTKTSRGFYFACKNEVPEVETNGDAYFESCLVRYNNQHYPDQRVLWVDEGFEQVFRLNPVKGKADYTRPLTGMLSQSKASALFGNEEPIGKVIQVNEGMPVEITGVFSDLPSNTHLTADYFVSLKTWERYGWITTGGDWNFRGYWNYVKLKKGASPAVAEAKFTEITNSHLPQNSQEERKAKITLQPLSDLHFIHGLDGEMGAQTNPKSLYYLAIVGLLIIVLAWINYINLSTAQSAKRTDEIGMRKLIGATRLHLWIQSFFETVMTNFIAFFLALSLYFTLLKAFATYFEVPLMQASFRTMPVFLTFIGVSAIGILFPSIYNTIKLARINPFAGKKDIQGKAIFTRGLVIAQIAISIFFISNIFTVYTQIQYMKNADLGINLNQVITFSGPASLNTDSAKRSRFLSFRTELLEHPEFMAATANTFTTGQEPRFQNAEYIRPNSGAGPNATFLVNVADDGLIETFGMKLLAGKGFSSNIPENQRKIIINERSLEALEFSSPEEAIGSVISPAAGTNVQFEIIGVVADFHNEGLQKPIPPMVYFDGHPFEFGYYSVRLNTPDVFKAIDMLKAAWEKHYPTDPMNYFFADEFFNRQYQSEARFGKFYSILTILSIFIACLGLYGLIVFYLTKKRKEIGIRKINGAKVSEVLFWLNMEIMIWVTIAFCIAVPVAYYAMHKWLQNFAYRIELNWWIFILAGLVALIIAQLTVSLQAYRAATRNPVEALKYE